MEPEVYAARWAEESEPLAEELIQLQEMEDSIQQQESWMEPVQDVGAQVAGEESLQSAESQEMLAAVSEISVDGEETTGSGEWSPQNPLLFTESAPAASTTQQLWTQTLLQAAAWNTLRQESSQQVVNNIAPNIVIEMGNPVAGTTPQAVAEQIRRTLREEMLCCAEGVY
ncbi:MAG: hypothetical protein ACOX7F_05375 [Eubacteriales bacterium]|jgi:hypothetical protein